MQEWAAVFDQERFEVLGCGDLPDVDRQRRPGVGALVAAHVGGAARSRLRRADVGGQCDRRLALFADVEHRVLEAGHMVHFDVPDELVAVTAGFLGRRLG